MIALDALLAAVRNLCEARGHVLDATIQDSMFDMTARCSRCERWVTLSLGPSVDEQSITGRALAKCTGTPWGPPAAQPVRID